MDCRVPAAHQLFCFLRLHNNLYITSVGMYNKNINPKRNKLMSKLNACLRNGQVSFGADLSTVAEVTHLFGRKAMKLPYHSWFNVPGKKDVIGWLPSEEGGKGWHNVPEYGPSTDSCGWNEILTIAEFNDDAAKTATRIEEELAVPKTRYVFWREERGGTQWYKFYGTFEIDADSTRAAAASENPRVIYRRVLTTAERLKVDDENTVFTDAEFAGLKGHVVKVNFYDEFEFAADCGETVTGRIMVWPGMKFLVADVASNFIRVTCGTEDEDVLDSVTARIPVAKRAQFHGAVSISIPRCDFALGYVGVLPGTESLGDPFAAKPATAVRVRVAA